MRRYVSAKDLSTYRGGGIVETLFEPESVEELIDCAENGRIILGGGSNVLIDDNGIECAVSTAKMNGINFDANTVYADCGVNINRLILECRKRGLCGLEFLQGVPCSVGGATRMNAGAYGAELKDYVVAVDTLTADYVKRRIYCDDINWGYRKGVEGIITGVLFRFDYGESPYYDCIIKRRKNQPHLPSLGCVFKNGIVPSGMLVEQAGLKGCKVGGAMISDVHANFIVNTGCGSANDYLALVNIAKEKVYDKFGIMLESEFVYVEGK